MANTVKVRVAVAVDEDGDWFAYGGTGTSERNAKNACLENMRGDCVSCHFIEAELPIPEIQTIQAKVRAT